MTRQVNFFLNAKRIGYMRDGTGHQFFSRAKTAFESLGLRVDYREDTIVNRQNALHEDAYAMFWYHHPTHDRALDVRRTAIGPFYRIEAAPVRSKYRLVDRVFDPGTIDPQKAQSFFKIWQRLLKADPPAAPQGSVLIPLQGKLRKRRSMQAMSPIDMIKTTIAQDPGRKIWLKPHPKETYDAADRAALDALCEDRVRIYKGDLKSALQGCDYIVTQNSAVLLEGLFYQRPAIVFADCEYHHAFQSVRRGVKVADAFAQVTADTPDFAKYAYWYLQLNCINTSREWAEEMIISQCREFGWKI